MSFFKARLHWNYPVCSYSEPLLVVMALEEGGDVLASSYAVLDNLSNPYDPSDRAAKEAELI